MMKFISARDIKNSLFFNIVNNTAPERAKNMSNKKRVSYFYRAAQLSTLAAFPPWGSSRGAGRKRLTPPQI